MATSINIRIDDELEKKLKKAVGDIKAKTPRGAEVNNSTIVRGAVRDFIEKIDNENKGIKYISFNIGNVKSRSEREELYIMLEKYLNMTKEEGNKEIAKYISQLLIGAMIEVE